VRGSSETTGLTWLQLQPWCAGAELQAVVRRATNWALDENLNKSNLKDVPKDFHPIIERRHFDLVLERDIKAAFGSADDALATYHREGIFSYGPRFDEVVQQVYAAAKLSEAVPKSTILLQGTHSMPACCAHGCQGCPVLSGLYHLLALADRERCKQTSDCLGELEK
jgi:hypothetical protein